MYTQLDKGAVKLKPENIQVCTKFEPHDFCGTGAALLPRAKQANWEQSMNL